MWEKMKLKHFVILLLVLFTFMLMCGGFIGANINYDGPCTSQFKNASMLIQNMTASNANSCDDFLNDKFNSEEQIVLLSAFKNCRKCLTDKRMWLFWLTTAGCTICIVFCVVLCIFQRCNSNRFAVLSNRNAIFRSRSALYRRSQDPESEWLINNTNRETHKSFDSCEARKALVQFCRSDSLFRVDEDSRDQRPEVTNLPCAIAEMPSSEVGLPCTEGGKVYLRTSSRQFKKSVDGTLKRRDISLLHETMKSVGVIFRNHSGRGTAVRVGSKYIMTAWHIVKEIVLESKQVFLGKDKINHKLLARRSVYVNFHACTRQNVIACTSQSPTSLIFHLEPEIVFCDTDLDICVLAMNVEGLNINDLPPPIQHFADVHSLQTLRNSVSCVHIIGQHPNQEDVVIDTGCKVISYADEKMTLATNWIEENKTVLKEARVRNNLDPNVVDSAYFDVQDTERKLVFDSFLDFGSSGAAAVIIHADVVQLAGIVTHGLPPFYWDKVSDKPYPESLRMEVSSTMKAIMNSSNWHGKQHIREEIFRLRDTESDAEPMEF